MNSVDCSWARRELTQGPWAVQLAWRYDRPVDLERLEAVYTQLQRGRLGRVAAPAIVGAAGDRWTAHAEFAPLDVGTRPLERSELNDWLVNRGNEEVRTYGGPAWRLAVTDLADGGAAVSLVASHDVTDGQGLFLAVVEAVSGTNPNWTYAADNYGRMRMLAVETVAAAGRLSSFAFLGLTAWLASLTARPSEPDPAALELSRSQPLAAEVVAAARSAGIIRWTVAVDAQQWHAAATSRGGTSTTLTTAVMGDLAKLLGRVAADGWTRIFMPISTRTGVDDMRANAVRMAVCLADPAGRPNDLAPLRATMKQAYQESGSAKSLRIFPDAARAIISMPRDRLARLVAQHRAQSAGTPDLCSAECSVVGEVDPVAACIDGAPAASVCCSWVRQDERDPTTIIAAGGMLRGLMVQTNNEVTIRMTAIHPPVPLSVTAMQQAVATVFKEYGLTASFW